jgi:hypothetical protein
MAYDLVDFSDIKAAIKAELKIQDSDDTADARIERDINMIYINEVAPLKNWKWLRKNVRLVQDPYFSTGTATVTPDSATVTLSNAPTTSKTGYFFATDGFDEVYYVSAHTASSTTVTLSSAFKGVYSTTATFKIWKDWVTLPTNCRETFEVAHGFHSVPMEGVGLQEFRRIFQASPRAADRPYYYTTDDFVDPDTTGDGETESNRYRILRIHPAQNTNSTTLYVDYIQDVTALDVDADEPLMPINDRIVLFYGAASLAWTRERNPEEAARCWQLFQNKLAQMAGRNGEDSMDKPQLTPDNRYISNKRSGKLARYKGIGLGSGGGGASYTSPNYIANANIATGNTLTGNLSVDSGITIDGYDISAMGAEVDTMYDLASGKILVGNSSNVATQVTPSGDITVSNTGVTAIVADTIVNADVNSAAAIAFSKMAALTASRVAVSTAGGVVDTSAITSTELTYLDDTEPLTSATLTDNTTVTVASWAAASFNSISIEYSIKRATAFEKGRFDILTDASTVEYTQYAVLSIGTMGVTLTADLDSGNVRLRSLQTSTGTAGTMKFTVRKHLNS